MARVAVVGAGAIGLYTALEALKRGHKVDVYEARTRVIDSASAKMPGLLMPIERPFESFKNKLVMAGFKEHLKLSEELGYNIRRINLILPYESRFLDKLMWIPKIYLKRYGVDLHILRGEKLFKKYPELNRKFVGGVEISGYGLIDPLDTLMRVQEAITDMGGGFYLGYKVPPITKEKLINGIEYDYVVVAAGPHTREVVRNVVPPPRQRFGKGIYAVTSLEIDYIIRHFTVLGWRYTRGLGFAPYYKGVGSIFGATFSWTPAKEDYRLDYDSISMALKNGMDLVKEEPDIISVHCIPRVVNYPSNKWMIRIRDGVVATYGISTPGFTAAPAIAKYILDRLI